LSPQAGITVGRATIPFLAKRIGDGVLVYGLVVGAMGFQVLSWQVPNIVGASGTFKSHVQ